MFQCGNSKHLLVQCMVALQGVCPGRRSLRSSLGGGRCIREAQTPRVCFLVVESYRGDLEIEVLGITEGLLRGTHLIGGGYGAEG